MLDFASDLWFLVITFFIIAESGIRCDVCIVWSRGLQVLLQCYKSVIGSQRGQSSSFRVSAERRDLLQADGVKKSETVFDLRLHLHSAPASQLAPSEESLFDHLTAR